MDAKECSACTMSREKRNQQAHILFRLLPRCGFTIRRVMKRISEDIYKTSPEDPKRIRQDGYTDNMIEVSPGIHLGENELTFDFIRASGPGGQNVNKVASSVQLRFDIRNSPSLEPEIKERLIKLAGSAVTTEGVLVLTARRFRTQEQNRQDAIQRLVNLIQKAAVKPRTRQPTRPGAAASGARIRSKMRRGEIKRTRRFRPEDWE